MENLTSITTFPIAETFFSIQGEGSNTGKAAFFVRIAGCDVCCSWCDEKNSWDDSGFPHKSTQELLNEILASGADTVVFTGGEPFRFALDKITQLLHKHGIATMAETSGTEPISGKWDWIAMSPKKHRPPLEVNFQKINELKVVIQQISDFSWAETMAQQITRDIALYLQPEWSNFSIITPEIISFIKQHPEWRLSVQVHKFLQIP